uniref:Uncharacterized protein n=1 Tax=Tanacetum cinerariifolium TaxID=118510 RepID=A0A6L2L2R6_TANCI|nr:hypothetical protein [Tanacetum cinerariifolium]
MHRMYSFKNVSLRSFPISCLLYYDVAPHCYHSAATRFWGCYKSQFNLGAYKSGLASVEARLEVYKKNEAVFKDGIKILKLDVMLRDKAITKLRQKFEKAKNEKDDLKLTLEKFKGLSKNLSRLLDSQQSDKSKTGLGYDSQGVNSQVLENQVNDKYNTCEGYHAIPPPYTWNYMPPKLDLVFADEHVVSDEDEDEIETESKQIKPSFAKEKFVKSTKHVKSPRKSVKQEKILTNYGLKTLNTAKHPSSRAAVSINTARPINTAYSRSTVNDAKPSSNVFQKSHSPVRRTFNQRTTPQNNGLKETVNTAKVNNVTNAGTKAVVSDVQGNRENDVKSSACWIWRPTCNVIDHISKDSGSYMLKRFNYVDLQGRLKHMTGNKFFLTDYQEIDGGFVAFGGSPKGEKPTECDGFEQIVDFLNANPINLVYGKKVIVNEASIRRDLRLDDAEGTACLPNAAVFKELARMRRKQRKETEVSQDETPTKEHIPTPSHDPLPSGEDRLRLNELIEICTNLSDRVLSLEQINNNQAVKIKKLKKRVKKLKGKKKRTHRLKRIYKGRIAEIDADEDLSLINETVQDQGRMNNQYMFGVNDLDGDEVVVDVSLGEKKEQSEKVAEKEVSTADPVTAAGKVVTTADVEVSAALTTTTTNDEFTMAQTLIEIKAAKPKALTTATTTVTAVIIRLKEKGIIMKKPSEMPSPKPIVYSQQPSQPKDKGNGKMVEPERPLKRKEQIMMDERIAKDLEAQMQADLEEEQRIAKQKEEEANIAMIAEWDNTQAMMDADYELVAKL